MRVQQTIRTLNDLIRTCRGTERLCRVGSLYAESSDLAALLNDRVDEWGRLGDELQALVLLFGGNPARRGAANLFALARWLSFKAAAFGASDWWVIDSCHAAQQRALQHYEHALGDRLPQRIRHTVSLQTDRIMDRLDTLDRLRRQLEYPAAGAGSV
jgi:uncharacterized protein (TIGR02284 family)